MDGGQVLPPGEATPQRFLNTPGYVDSITRSKAIGWAWWSAAPEMEAHVEAVLDGRVIGRALANRLRQDLLNLDIGTGRYGFELSFDVLLTGSKMPILQMVGPAGPVPLPAAIMHPELETIPVPPQLAVVPAVEKPPPSAVPPTAAEPATQALRLPSAGHIDELTRNGASGWAWSPAAPELVVLVEAVLGDRVIGRALADQQRGDLLEQRIGTGHYGFRMSFDAPITGGVAPEFRVLIPAEHNLTSGKPLPPLTPDDVSPRPRAAFATWSQEHAEFTSKGPEYEDFDPTLLARTVSPTDGPKPLLLAFYLPQFHAIPENDQFWGTGFTEWRQLPRGVSRFPGHYQPRIPRDLGFYDLSDLNALKAQCQLATAAGIQAFTFYYYWFNGRRVLEKPLNRLLDSDVNMPFMILWANENWTRTWDGSETELLLKQDYDLKDEPALLDDLARHFLDPRYVRIGGRPLFVIYNPEKIPDAPTTVARWREGLKARCRVEPLIFMAQTFGARDPGEYGFDGALEFPPHKTAENLVTRFRPDAYSSDYDGMLVAYDKFVAASLNEPDKDYPLIKTVVPSWDNEARRPNRGLTLTGLSPSKYEHWLRTLIVRAMQKPILGTPIVAINAWNEWAEAAYLEPDVYYGASFLNATARAYQAAVTGHKREHSALNGEFSRPEVN